MKRNYQNHQQDSRLDNIEKHTDTMNREFGEFKIANTEEHARLETDLEWIKRHYWIVGTAATGGLIAGLINLLLKK